MSRDPRSLGEPTRRPDPVAEFFAGERGAVIDRPGSDEHWAEVLMLAQVAPRRRRRGYVAAAAAAVVIAVAITLSQSTPELEPPSSIPSSPGMSTTLPSGTTTGPLFPPRVSRAATSACNAVPLEARP